jgi:plastocyanin
MRRSARTRLGVAVAAVTIPLTLVGCSSSTPAASDSPTTTAAPVNSGKSVTIVKVGDGFKYDPEDVTVKVGDTLTWTNSGGTKHTVSSESGQAVEFKSPTMQVGETYVRTFDKPGTFTYFCSIHGDTVMKGTITVTA